MRFRGTLVLFVTALVLGAVVFFVEQPRHRQRIEREEKAKRITQLERKDIVEVTVQRQSGDTLRFTKRSGVWQMLSPVSDRAEASSVNVLVQTVVNARIERRLDIPDTSLVKFRLDPPEAVITLATADGDTTLVVRVGRPNLTKSHCYALVDTARTVYLLPEDVRRYALKEVDYFRNKKVIEFDVDEVQRFEVSGGDHPYWWERDREGRWFTMVVDDTIPGDRTNVETVLRQIRGLRVREFVSDDPRDFERFSRKGVRKVTFWIGQDRAKKELLFGDKIQRGVYAKRPSENRIVLVDPTILEIFDKTLKDLRDRKLLHFTRADLRKITVERPDTVASIVKEGTDWTYPNPEMGSIEQYRVSTFLYRLETFRFDEAEKEQYPEPEGHGFDEPYLKVTLYGEDGEVIDEVLVGAKRAEGEGRYATSRSTRRLVLVTDRSIQDVLKAFDALPKK
jgi:hypothetical protein